MAAVATNPSSSTGIGGAAPQNRSGNRGKLPSAERCGHRERIVRMER